MNDARRQLLHEAYKLVDVSIMVVAFLVALWIHGAAPPPADSRLAEGGVDGAATLPLDPSLEPGSSSVPAAANASTPAAGSDDAAPSTEPTTEPTTEPSTLPTTELGEAATSRGAGTSGEAVPSATVPPASLSLEPVSGIVAPSLATGDPGTAGEGQVGRRGRPGQPSTAVALEADDGLWSWLASRLPSGVQERLERLEAVVFPGRKGTPLAGSVLILFTAIFAWYASFSSQGLYNSRRLDSPWREAVDVFRGGAFGSAVVLVLTLSWVKSRLGSDGDLLAFGITFSLLAIGTTVITRLAIRTLLEQMRLRGRNLRGVLVIGTNHRALRFARSLEKKRSLGYYVVGFVDEDWDGIAGFKKGGGRLVSRLEDLGSYLANHVVDEVVVALPVSSAYVHSSRIVGLCQEQGITVRFVSQIFDSRLAKGKLDVFDGEPMLSLEGAPAPGFPKLLKAIFDRCAAAVLLLVLSPLLLVVALAIKLTSPEGPVLFVQRRVGLNKRMFDVYKFRTMVPDAEARLQEIEHLNQVSGPVFKIEKDPRLTPIGDFLRKTSIDELPQLINVLKGDMSLVGPRPLPERDYKGFDKDAHRRRLSVRPGITCTWQVGGRNSIPFEKWMELDLEYIDDWSLWSDVKILLQTIPVVLGPLVLGKKGEFMGSEETIDDDPGSEAITAPTRPAPTRPAPTRPTSTRPAPTGPGLPSTVSPSTVSPSTVSPSGLESEAVASNSGRR